MQGESSSEENKMDGLRIRSLSFLRFRNYDFFDLGDLGGLTVFIGNNAVGKTNVLEGIQLLTSASSFRHPQIFQLIKEGANDSRIALRAGDGNRDLSMELLLSEGKRRYVVNGKHKSAVDVRGILPSVMFTPDDLQLVKRSSSAKRAALDDLGMQLTRNYYIVRKDYEKAVRFKNRLLKDNASQALVESIDETLITCGAQLFYLRTALFERMLPFMKEAYSLISGNGEPFSASYLPSWARFSGIRQHEYPKKRDDIRNVLANELLRARAEEGMRGRCLIGPHADEIQLSLGGRDAGDFASQGQQRSIVLAWKLAEVQMVREVMGIQPVLLLDDVLSELDGSRREMLVRFVTEDIQTFITATDLDGFSPGFLDKANVVRLPLSR